MAERWLMLGVLFVVRLAMGYQFQAIASAAPQLVSEFGFSYAEIGTLIGLFLLPGIFIAMPSGLLTRTVADRHLLIAGAAFMIAGALIMAFAASPQTLYAGRIVTGIGGTIFNVVLTKMVTDWFFEKEIVSALAVMLTAWPIGIALGLLSQGWLAEHQGWTAVMYAIAALALVSLLLTAFVYRDPPRTTAGPSELRFRLPRRQLVHMSIVGVAWTCFNACLIVIVSFAPAVLQELGYDSESARSTTSLVMWVTLVSLPFGGRLIELIGQVTLSISIGFLISAAGLVMLANGVMPELTLLMIGIAIGIPAGALMALTSEAVTADNRGPGLGLFYTWYFAGMTVFPAIAGLSRDLTGAAAAPLYLAAGLVVVAVAGVLLLRVLQRHWPIVPLTGGVLHPSA